jgi:hypothetical protein
MQKKWHLVVARAIVTEPKGSLKIKFDAVTGKADVIVG